MRRAVMLLLVLIALDVRAAAIVERVECLKDPTQTYALYLPSNYSEQTKHPLLFIFDPRGRGAMAAELFRPGAERLGWIILSSNNTRSDGPADPNTKAINAMWPEMARYSVDGKRLYAAGFSGGGILTLLLGVSTGALAGVIDVGGHMVEGLSLEKANFAHYGASARYDFNFLEMADVDEAFAKRGVAHRLDRFDGTHAWMPQELATSAMSWLEVVAMKEKRRVPDAKVIDALYAEDLARQFSRKAEAMRHLEMMKRTFDGLRPVEEVDAAIARLRADAELARDRDLEQKEARYEKTMLRAMITGGALLREADPLPPAGAIRSAYRIDALQRDAKGPMADAARRVIESVFTQTSFYIPRDFFEAKDPRRAAAALEIARELRPDAPYVHVQLARAYARLRQDAKAVEEIEAAIANGAAAAIRADTELQRLIEGNEKLRKLLE